MLDKFYVKRALYDTDMARMRDMVADITKELRGMETAKGEAKRDLKVKSKELALFRHEIVALTKRLERQVDDRSLKEYLPPVPKGETDRRAYVSQIAGMFQGGLKDKLNHLHLEFRNQTGMFPLTERETDFFRSCINVVGLLLDWGEENVAEHHANIASANDKGESDAFSSSEEGKESVDKIKEQIK